MQQRRLQQLWPARQVSDGAGVTIQRSLGLSAQLRLDPFLMLDCFGSDQPDEYIAGFPPHPHRGFETVTYMLDGTMLHEDHLGNRGLLVSGGVQWMTAGSGIIHSEMPQQEHGLMRGFQLWLNLPASEKMQPPAYLDLSPSQIPVRELQNQDGAVVGRVKVIAGTFQADGYPAIQGPVRSGYTAPLYLDLQFDTASKQCIQVPSGHNALLYPYEGQILLHAADQQQILPRHQAAILSDGSSVTISSDGPMRCLLLAGRPIGEPVVQYGPFVMNTAKEIEQAVRDYQQGRLTAAPAQARQPG